MLKKKKVEANVKLIGSKGESVDRCKSVCYCVIDGISMSADIKQYFISVLHVIMQPNKRTLYLRALNPDVIKGYPCCT